jgi:hypothetical protein
MQSADGDEVADDKAPGVAGGFVMNCQTGKGESPQSTLAYSYLPPVCVALSAICSRSVVATFW